MSQATDASQPDSLAAVMQTAARRAGEIQTQIDTVLADSTNPLAESLRSEMSTVVHAIGEAAERLAGVEVIGVELIATWGGGTAESQQATQPTAPLPPIAQTVSKGVIDSYFNLETEPFNPKHNLMDPDIQRRMDTPVERVFGPDAVGEDASRRILGQMERKGLKTIHDVLLAGKRGVFGSLGRDWRYTIEAEVYRVCPEAPFNNYLSPESAAQMTDSIDNVPIQAILPGYQHSTRKRVTIGDTIDKATGRYNNQGPARFKSPERTIAAALEEFTARFNRARHALTSGSRVHPDTE